MARKHLPKFIKVGSVTYKVIKHRKAGKDLGSADFNKRIIHLSKQEAVELPNTLAHECLHVILEDIIKIARNETKDNDDLEEDIVRLLTPRFLSLLQENPELLAYLT